MVEEKRLREHINALSDQLEKAYEDIGNVSRMLSDAIRNTYGYNAIIRKYVYQIRDDIERIKLQNKNFIEELDDDTKEQINGLISDTPPGGTREENYGEENKRVLEPRELDCLLCLFGYSSLWPLQLNIIEEFGEDTISELKNLGLAYVHTYLGKSYLSCTDAGRQHIETLLQHRIKYPEEDK